VKKFITGKVIVIVLTILFGIITAYFHNKHQAEISVIKKQKDSLINNIQAQDIIIKDLMDKDPGLVKRIDSNKIITNEKVDRVSHFSTDSLVWYFSRGQYLNR
jgi:hypothetical protein